MNDLAGDDSDLLDAVRAGDERAFEVLFERHVDAVYNFVFRRSGSWDDAEEAVSVVFFEAWRQRGRVVAAEGSLRPWLFGVATNVMRRASRTRQRRARAIARSATLMSDAADPTSDVAGRIDDERRMTAVLHLLERLPRPQRDVMMLHLEGLSYVDIAAALQIRVGTVRSRLNRARFRIGQDVPPRKEQRP